MGILTFFGFNSNEKIKTKLIKGQDPHTKSLAKTIKSEKRSFNRELQKLKKNGSHNP